MLVIAVIIIFILAVLYTSGMLDEFITGTNAYIWFIVEVFADPKRVESVMDPNNASAKKQKERYVDAVRWTNPKINTILISKTGEDADKVKIQNKRQTERVYWWYEFAFKCRRVAVLAFIILFLMNNGATFNENFL